MKLKIVALGLSLILLGFIVTALRDYTIESEPTIDFAELENKWSLTREFTENEASKEANISFDFRPGADWVLDMFEVEPVELPPVNGTFYNDVKFLDVNVTSPMGNYTMFRFFLVLDQTSNLMTVFPDYIEVLKQTGGIRVDEGYPRAEILQDATMYDLGKVEHAGLYSITLSMDYPILDQMIMGPTRMKFDWVNVTDSLGNRLFADDFSDANKTTSTWRLRMPVNSSLEDLASPWTVADGIYSYYSSTNQYEGVQTSYVGNSTWSDYKIETNTSYIGGAYGPHIVARLNETSGERYAFGVYPNGDIEGPNKAKLLKFDGWNRRPTTLAEAQVLTDTQWHTLSMDLTGPSIRCYYDGALVVNVNDSSISSGLAGLETTVMISRPWRHLPSPPADVIVYSVSSDVSHPYSGLLYAGASIAVTGTCVTAAGLWIGRKKTRRLRK